MGHAVNSTGFRLLRERHWVEGVSAGLYSVLDRFLLQLFHLHLPHHLYSHLLLHPTPSGRLHLHLHLYSHLWVAFPPPPPWAALFWGGGAVGGWSTPLPSPFRPVLSISSVEGVLPPSSSSLHPPWSAAGSRFRFSTSSSSGSVYPPASSSFLRPEGAAAAAVGSYLEQLLGSEVFPPF